MVRTNILRHMGAAAAVLAVLVAGGVTVNASADATSSSSSSADVSAVSSSSSSASVQQSSSTSSASRAAVSSSSSAATATSTSKVAVQAAPSKTVISGVVTKTGTIKLPVAAYLQEGPGVGYKVLRTLAAGTNWKYFSTRDYQGRNWYDLGGDQWVGIKKGTKPATNSSSVSGVVSRKGIVNITTTVNLQAGPGNGWQVLRTLKAGSSWKYNQVRSYQNKTWYNLGGNQWIGVRSNQVSNYSGVINQSGVVRMNANNYLQAGPGNGYRILRTLKYGTSWKYNQVRNYQGKHWYNLGGGQWASLNPKVVDWRGPSEATKSYPNLAKYPHMWIKVSLANQRTYLMNGNTVLYTMLCSTGRPGATTPKGTYYIQKERGPVFGGSLGGARYYVSWKDHGIYLFHSVPITGNGAYMPGEGALLGKKAHSHGCIRLTVSDSYWLYTHVKYGTKVVIY